MLCYGHGYADDVHLLEAVSADEVTGDVSGYGDHRHGIEECGSYAGDKVGRTGTRCSYDNADLSGSSCIAVCGMRSALLMGGQDVSDTVAAEVQLVEEVDDLSAGVAEYGVAALFNESFNNYLCT